MESDYFGSRYDRPADYVGYVVVFLSFFFCLGDSFDVFKQNPHSPHGGRGD